MNYIEYLRDEVNWTYPYLRYGRSKVGLRACAINLGTVVRLG